MKTVIYKEFERYGEIRFIEERDDPMILEDEAIAKVYEAYVTYMTSKSAYEAFIGFRRHNTFPREALIVVPADSWRQNEVVMDASPITVKQQSEQNQMDDAVLWHRMFAEFSIKNRTPAPLRHKLLIDVRHDVTLNEWRSLAYEIGKDLEYLLLKLSPYIRHPSDDKNRLTDQEFENRVIQIVAKECASDKFRIMSITTINEIHSNMLLILRPLLEIVQTLIIDNENNTHMLYPLSRYCPNLRLIRMTGIWDGECEHEPPEEWTSLKILILTHRKLNVNSHTDDGKKFHIFIERNPQIDMLVMDTIIDTELLQKIAAWLPVIKVLKFRREDYFGFSRVFEILAETETLETIGLTFNTAEKPILAMIPVMIEEIRNNQTIKLMTFIQNSEPDTSQFGNFMHLNGFSIVEHRGCDCHPRRTLTFNEVITEMEIPDDSTVLVIVVNTNDQPKPNDTAPVDNIWNMLQMTKNESLFFDIIRKEELEESDHTVFIYVATSLQYIDHDVL